MRHLITLNDVNAAEVSRIFAITEDLKTKYQQGLREPLLPGRTLAMLFEKQSLRTRISFEAGMTHLGGNSIMMGDDVGFGKRESVADFSRVLGEMVDVVVIRSKQHATVEEFAKYSTCSVINGLTDESHPCQALGDLYTMREHFGSLDGVKLAWIGDANNVARSLVRCCGLTGVKFAICTPPGYEFDAAFLADVKKRYPNLSLEIAKEPRDAVRGASAVYTDVWASMGQEAERTKRLKDFANYQVSAALMSAAPSTAVFMHCLPARRGEEVTDEVIDSPQSVVVAQAANRMHVQKGILVWLLGAQA